MQARFRSGAHPALVSVQSLPATVPKRAVSLLKEFANHAGRFAAGQVMGITTVLPFFAQTVHEISGNTKGNQSLLNT